MINIDSRLLDQVDPDELYLLSRLVNRMNKDGTCWPGTDLLVKECNWSRSKLLRVKKGLYDKKLISSITRRKENSPELMSNIYKLQTNLIASFVPSVKIDTTPCQNGHYPSVTSEATLVSEMPLPSVRNEAVSINQEVLTTEVLISEELNREKEHVSFLKSNVFEELIDVMFPQFKDHRWFYRLQKDREPTDATTKEFLEKLSRAAEKIYEATKGLNRPRFQIDEDKMEPYRDTVSRRTGRKKDQDLAQEMKWQICAYHDFCRLSKTHMTTRPEKLPEKMIEADWPFKLYEFVKSDIQAEKYDPACDDDLWSYWLRELYYFQPLDVFVCRRYNNRILWGDMEYLHFKK